MNLGKLVPLEVRGRLGNAKIAKKYFTMSKWGKPYTVGKLRRKAFQQAKEHANHRLGWRDTAPESLKTKSREFPIASRSDPRGGPAEGCRSIYMGECLRVAARSRY